MEPPPPTHDPAEHLHRLQRALALERGEEEKRFREERERRTLAERVAHGSAVDDGEVTDESWGLGGRLLLTLARASGAPVGEAFEPGAVVEVLAKGDDGPGQRAVVARRAGRELQLAFDTPPRESLGTGRLVVEVAPNDVTFRRANEAIAAVRTMEHGSARRRRETLFGREPARFAACEITGIADTPAPLNAEQRSAVERALAAQDFFLVHGPPGTGKSTVLAEVAARSVARGERVVATAASNAAVDHLLSLLLARDLRAIRLGHPARVAPHLQQHTLDELVAAHPQQPVVRDLFDEAAELAGYARKQRQRGRSRERFAQAREAKERSRELAREGRRLERLLVEALLADAQVLCCTLTALGGAALEAERFDLAIVDEATQATEPLTLLAFCKADKLVLGGDHRQLPPTVLSREAAELGLDVSLFERLLAMHGDAVKVMLREQYRMHEAIMRFPSAQMYAGELRAHPSVAGRTLELSGAGGEPLDTPPVLFVDTAGKGFDEELGEDGESWRNPGEADLVVARVRRLVDAGLAAEELAVIAPYSAQVALVRDLARAAGIPPRVEIDTVDAFQGREKDAVLVSLTRANAEGNLGFLTDLRRLNVAITRPRKHLFVVGDSATLAAHPFYAAMIEAAQAEGAYRSAWAWG